MAGLWPVVTPIPQPGWIETVPGVPNWPASLVQDPPTTVSNQCVAGTEWAYGTTHATSFHFPSANGVDVARAAAAAGLIASSVPKAGDLVSFTIPGSAYGHVALVIAVAADRFEVVEQNYIDTQGYASQWNPNGWDVRSVAWPNSSVTRFAGI